MLRKVSCVAPCDKSDMRIRLVEFLGQPDKTEEELFDLFGFIDKRVSKELISKGDEEIGMFLYELKEAGYLSMITLNGTLAFYYYENISQAIKHISKEIAPMITAVNSFEFDRGA